MNHANDNTRFVTLPAFHPARMELTSQESDALNDPAKFAASRAAYRAQLRRINAIMRVADLFGVTTERVTKDLRRVHKQFWEGEG